MTKTFIHIGNGHRIVRERLRSISPIGSEPIRREIQNLRKNNRLIDATKGRKARTLVTTICGYAYLSMLTVETIENRANNDIK